MSQMEFDNQSCSDLEFDLIRMILHDYCVGPTAQLRMSELEPSDDRKSVSLELFKAKEFVNIRQEGQGFPAIDFDELDKEIRALSMKGGALEADSFLKIRRDSELVNTIVSFLKSNRERFVHLHGLTTDIKVTKDLLNAIDKVFDPKGKIRDDASSTLKEIRSSIAAVRRQISRNFNKELKRFTESGLLGETREAFVNDRRVLTVVSSSKRQVQGSILGSSKTGSLTYIEPQINVPLNFELEMLFDDERNEIRKILQQLTEVIREHLDLVRAYQSLLTELDFIQAKARLAADLDANLPEISSEQIIELHKAYHPILLLSNRKEGHKTLPQSLTMDKFSRMLVISGPNAGGKSISLKMVGLIQVMFQSGLLVPLEPHSKLGFFQSILTDIGDHQSIENQLSTYSYRLKRMKRFLELSNRRTLLLLDEFGTGSDPELGGALAEVFFEELYNKKSFGVVTTHYSNIKLKAADLRNAVNGCMLFDRESLEPLFQLSIGQPGSSFTFEVAEINGISKELIEEAKTRLDDRKVQLDKMISELQKEKAIVEKVNKAKIDAEHSAIKSKAEFEKKTTKLDDRLQQHQLLQERNNQYISRGKKMQSFIDALGGKAKVKAVFDEVKKYISVERAKIDDAKKQEKLKQKVAAKKKGAEPPKPKHGQENIKAGSTVRLQNSKQIGTVIEIDGKKAVVAFGVFKTNIDTSKLVFVK